MGERETEIGQKEKGRSLTKIRTMPALAQVRLPLEHCMPPSPPDTPGESADHFSIKGSQDHPY